MFSFLLAMPLTDSLIRTTCTADPKGDRGFCIALFLGTAADPLSRSTPAPTMIPKLVAAEKDVNNWRELTVPGKARPPLFQIMGTGQTTSGT